MNTLAIAMGGHCRVGLEDNIYYRFDRSELATNHGLVERLAHLAETFGRPLASSRRAREVLGLGPSAARIGQAPEAARAPAPVEALA
jgi:3-keto-5-aminohexanoate cleavage enzyme